MTATQPIPATRSEAEDLRVGSPRFTILLVGLSLGLLLSELDNSIFATAMPTVVGELAGADRLVWVNTSYILAGTVMMPVYGRLSDSWGRRSTYVAALAIFCVGSVVGGLAPDMTTLIIARTIQGIGGGGLLILIQAIVADLIVARRRAPYLTAIDAVFAVGAILGPVAGGWLTENAGWRWAFWINLPLGAVAMAAALWLLPGSPRRTRVVFDLRGSVTLAAAVVLIVLLATWGGTRYAWGSPLILFLAASAFAALVDFVRTERRAVQPIVPPALFADRNFTVAAVAGLVLAAAMFGTVGYLPTYLQMVTGLSPTRAGLMMLTLIAGLALTTVVSAQVISRTGRYATLPVAGAIIVAAALAGLATLTPSADPVRIGVFLFLLGAGTGFAWEVLVIVVQNSSDPGEVGVATATYGLFRETGVLLGTAVVGSLFSSRLFVRLDEALPPGAGGVLDPTGITPGAAAALPAELQAALATAYNDALTPIFLGLVPLVGLGVAALCLLRPQQLADVTGDRD